MTILLRDVFREINNLPRESLWAGVSKKDRGAELSLLSTIISPTLILRCDFSSVRITYGCIRREEIIGLLVGIKNISYTEIFAYLNPETDVLSLEKNRCKKNIADVPQTSEEFSRFIEKIAFGRNTKAGA